jgi:hypothetical protein
MSALYQKSPAVINDEISTNSKTIFIISFGKIGKKLNLL